MSKAQKRHDGNAARTSDEIVLGSIFCFFRPLEKPMQIEAGNPLKIKEAKDAKG